MKSTFKRYEFKYLISEKQKQELLNLLKDYMILDKYGKNVICNVYYDTDEYLLIRRSLEKPIYKEKLRVRSYGVAKEDDEVFLELKKKFKSIVYKRRIGLAVKEIDEYFSNKDTEELSQIAKEIDYFNEYYKTLKPKVYISYQRAAYIGKEDEDFRITFDENILYRNSDLSLKSSIYGENLLENGMLLLEVKVTDSIPFWLVKFLSENKIYKTSFSKYGNVYTKFIKENSYVNRII